MPEKFSGKDPERKQFNDREYDNLLSRARQGVDMLSPQDCERLVRFGHHYLYDEKDPYKAMLAFEAAQDFKGLRKVADHLLSERPDSLDLPRVLSYLEDHEGIRRLLNREDIKFGKFVYEELFESLKNPLHDYIGNFLKENKMPVATGAVNPGFDLIAIRNLAQEYDIAVPIARGGLNQGAIAYLWGMPIRIVDIAAHKRNVARGKWINPVSAKDFDGKRVLLFDKDAVTGDTSRKAVTMLEKYQTKSIGVYFTHSVLEPGSGGIGTITRGLPEGLEIFSPHNASMKNAGEAYVEAHEKLETLYGRRRKMERQFLEEAEKLQERFPELAESLKAFALKQFSVFDSLNPNLAGIARVRENILTKVNQLYQEFKNVLKFLEKKKMDGFLGAADRFRRILETTQLLPLDFESEIIRARYRKQAEEAAKRRNVENPHDPSNPLAAFCAAVKAAKEGFDVALIVGPEGFAYEPYFHDLGIPTVAVNIPESGGGEHRTIKVFDNLAKLQGKNVLVVEDDVRTGATLQKLLETLEPHNPSRLGLYLGQPEKFQRMSNIPQRFETIYLAAESTTSPQEFREYLQSRNLKIFKF